MASVTVRNLDVAFDRPVLTGVDLDVADGETVALLGPSGSGKSTLLRVVAGLVRPDGGHVLVGTADMAGVPPQRRGVGVVFQDQALFPHLDVAGNVAFGLRMARQPRAERAPRVAELLALVGLAGYGDRDPATLSGGEAQRVAIARALAPSPGVLLLDEPFAALDQLLRERLLSELRTLFDRLGITVVAVTHDPTEAGALGARVAVMVDGRIAQIGPAGEVLSRPSSVAVARLVGQHNVVPATIEHGVLLTPWGSVPAIDRRAGPVTVLVSPDGLTPDPDGVIDGTVVGLLFRGGSAFASVATMAGPRLEVRAVPTWQVGDPVRLALDPTSVRVLDH